MRRFLINNEEIEGVTDVIAYTKKANEIGDLATRYLNFTNVFKIPGTPNNHRVLRNTFDYRSSTTLPYKTQAIQIIENGAEMVSGSRLNVRRYVVNKATFTEYYEVNIVSGTADFFAKMKGKKLVDLSLSAHTEGWDPNNMMNRTTGFFFPVINWGEFNGTSIDNNQNLPSAYYHTLINQIIADAGYNKAGSVFTSDRYLKTIVPYSREKFAYDPSVSVPFEFSAVRATINTFTPNFATVILFQNVIKSSPNYNGGTGKYTNNSSVTFYAHFFVQMTFSYTGGVGPVTLQLRKNGATVLSATGAVPNTNTLTPLTFDSRTMFPDGVPMQNTEEVYLMVNSVGAAGSLTVYADNSKFYNQVLDTVVASAPLGDTVFGKLLPDMEQTELMKDFMVRFGLIPSEKKGTVTFKTINEIISDKANALDWTSKRIEDTEELTFQPLSYARKNYFRDTSNDDVNKELGKGTLTIDNDNADEEKDIYTSVFNNTLTQLANSVLAALIPVFTVSSSTRPFDKEPGLRLLLVRDKYTFEPTLNGASAYKVAYYEDPQQALAMGWSPILTGYYSQLASAMQRSKVVQRKYNLTITDFLNIDFTKPVFDRDSYWLINEVKEFVNDGRPTTVELIKIQ